MDDDAVLIPVDVSGEEEGFPTSCEDLLEKARLTRAFFPQSSLAADSEVGASGAAKAIVDAAEFFETLLHTFTRHEFAIRLVVQLRSPSSGKEQGQEVR